jgi:GT2 family glycosyltransferase
MTAPLDIAVVVVGINSRDYVTRCLASARCAEWGAYSHAIVYVDNGSSDGSVEMVRADFPETVVVANERNVGFCQACNQAVAAVDSRYIYLLNNDTVVLTESIRLLVEHLDRTPHAAAAANRLLNPDLSDQWSARRFPTGVNGLFGRRTLLGGIFPKTAIVRDYLYKAQMAGSQPFEVDWVPGSCTMVRREAYEQVGGLPTNMHYWSDAVFCDRLHRRGWSIHVVPTAPLIHDEGQGTGGKSPSLRRWLITDFHQGAYRLYCEHNELGPWHPARWLARLALSARAQVLIAADALQHLGRPAHSQGA